MPNLSDKDLKGLSSPVNRNPLVLEGAQLKDSQLGANYPNIRKIPVLAQDPEFFLESWALRWQKLRRELGGEIDFLKSVLEKSVFLEEKMKRLQAYRSARVAYKKFFEAYLTPLDRFSQEHDTDTQDLVREAFDRSAFWTYPQNLFRDWAPWGAAENKLCFDYLSEGIKRAQVNDGEALILGNGFGRLSYDLLNNDVFQKIVAVDSHPVYQLIAFDLFAGEEFEVFEFPAYPRCAKDTAVKQRLAAPAPSRQGYRFLIANFLDLPFQESSWTTVVAPWFLDILPVPPDLSVRALNHILKPGGHLVFLGPMGFSYDSGVTAEISPEEFFVILERLGFEIVDKDCKLMPYLNSPHSAQQRSEWVWRILAKKVEHKEAPPLPMNAEPDWVLNENVPISEKAEYKRALVQGDLYSVILDRVDGKRSLVELAKEVASELKLSELQAKAIVTQVLKRFG